MLEASMTKHAAKPRKFGGAKIMYFYNISKYSGRNFYQDSKQTTFAFFASFVFSKILPHCTFLPYIMK